MFENGKVYLKRYIAVTTDAILDEEHRHEGGDSNRYSTVFVDKEWFAEWVGKNTDYGSLTEFFDDYNGEDVTGLPGDAILACTMPFIYTEFLDEPVEFIENEWRDDTNKALKIQLRSVRCCDNCAKVNHGAKPGLPDSFCLSKQEPLSASDLLTRSCDDFIVWEADASFEEDWEEILRHAPTYTDLYGTERLSYPTHGHAKNTALVDIAWYYGQLHTQGMKRILELSLEGDV